MAKHGGKVALVLLNTSRSNTINPAWIYISDLNLP